MLNDWRTVELADIADLSMGETLLSKNLTGDGIPVFSANTDEGPWGYTSNNRRRLRRGDIVIGARGSIGFPRRPNFEAFTCTQTTIAVQPDRAVVDSEYLHHALCAADILSIASQQAVPMLTIGALSPLEITLPKLDEQRRIAEVLRSVDEAIAANVQTLEHVQRTRNAIRDAHFGTQGHHWRTQTLGSLCDVTKLAGFEYTKHIQYGESDEIIAVRGLNIKDGRLVLDDIKTISRATAGALPRSSLWSGDLVMSYVGTIGEVAKIDEDDRFHLAPNVALLRCGQKVLPDYVLHFLYSRTGRDQISKHVSTSSQQSLSMSKIRSFEIALPSLDEQQRVTDTLGTINASLVNGMEAHSQLLARKANLMSDLLSGRVRVPA